MVLFVIYFLIALFFIYKNGFFGVFRDNVLNTRFYILAFLIKVAGLGAFYFIYKKIYGGINYSDTYNYFHESQIINSVAHWNFSEFVKLLFGFQNDGPDTELFQNYLRFTTVWDSDEGEWLYNDNRILLRFHALIHFISSHNYFVHAFISLFIGFIGIQWIYSCFVDKFKGKEILFFSTWLLFPGIWFWSSGLLKEGPVLFIMGLTLISTKRILNRQLSLKSGILFLLSLILCLTFKQYVLFPLLVFTFIYFIVNAKINVAKQKGIIYLSAVILLLLTGNWTVQLIKGKSVVDVLAERQKTFLDMSEGGIFLLDSSRFIRLPYDTTLIQLKETRNVIDKYVSIKKGAKYAYCEHTHQQDTLICENNTDTSSIYHLYYVVPKANSTIKVKPMQPGLTGFISFLPKAFFITTCKPFFVNIRNSMDLLTSVENLIILSFFFLLIIGVIRNKSISCEQIYWLSIVFFILAIIGITSPNVGAIERYRSPVIPFLLMASIQTISSPIALKAANFFKKGGSND